MAVTIADIAKECNCSIATVSLVMSGNHRISEKTRNKVLDAAKRMGYMPNYTATTLASGQTMTLGVIVPNLSNPTFCEMVDGIEKTASEYNYSILLGISNQSSSKEDEYIQMLLQKRIDGLLLFPTFLNKVIPTYSEFLGKKVPIFLCGSSLKTFDNIGYVKTDNRMGGYIATEHLIQSGRKRIACLCPVVDKLQAASRISGYADAHAFYGLDYTEDLIVYCSPQDDDIQNCVKKLLKEQRVDAIFSISDYNCIPVIKAIADMGLKIPDDIALIGYDNSSFSKNFFTPFSSVDIHPAHMGSIATKHLIELIQDPMSEPQKIILKPELIIRESS